MTTLQPTVAIGGAFALTDHYGQAVTDRTYLGKFALIYFGFTHCKKVCPEALAKLSDVLALLGPQAKQIQPLYITVDPARDSPEVMRAFLEQHYPRFTGLTGPKEQIDAVKRAYKVYAAQEDPQPDGSYDVPHSAMTFLMNDRGEYVTHFGHATTAPQIADRIGRILESAAT